MPERGLYIKSHRVSVEIDNQLAVTHIEQVFVNAGSGLAEGTYLFPLPPDAAVSDLKLYINGVAYEGKILDAKQAQQIYTEIVRRQRDPVLLQYVGRGAIQANIFPIPAGEERKIEIVYSSIATADNSLISYTYPLCVDYVSKLPVDQVSVSLTVRSKDPISTIYSPNPLVSISRIDDNRFRAGLEATNFRAVEDFTLYYGVITGEISANLLTYRGSANEDGFFMLMITPPSIADPSRVIPKDVLIVLDQSGSMAGEKWKQARAAAAYVLNNLNAADRFNAVVFSTGYRVFARSPQPVEQAQNAIQWINGLEAVGGTDINSALIAALDSADPTRQTILLFLTDGLPTGGVTNSKEILENVRRAANPNTRIFSFGVGNDVDTFLLDSLSSGYGGTSVYVRPGENIETKVSALYNKITSPVLTAPRLEVDGPVMLEDSYPGAPLPDLFAGTQLIVVGRYRGEGTITLTLSGKIDGAMQRYTYRDLSFPGNAGGQAFIPRLWATRKIGALLNQIRLNGETKELVDSVVRLSVRYGIITPYTSFLIQENNINPRGEDDLYDLDNLFEATAPPPGVVPRPIVVTPSLRSLRHGQYGDLLGAPSVQRAQESDDLFRATRAYAPPPMFAPTVPPRGGAGATRMRPTPQAGSARAGEVIKTVNDRTFVLRDGVWVDTQYTSEAMTVVQVVFLSDDYFKLLADHPEIGDYLALGERVLVVIGQTAYQIAPDPNQ